MRQKQLIYCIILMMAVVLLVSACQKKRIVSRPTTTTTAEEDEARRKELERQKAIEEEALQEESLKETGLSEEMQKERKLTEREVFQNEDIYFEFDSFTLNPAAQEILRKKARWLKENPIASVTIEGHCDSRGTNEYNLALGDRRAYGAKIFMVDLGINESRLQTISYGEERPIDPGESEIAWAKNRRAHFVLND